MTAQPTLPRRRLLASALALPIAATAVAVPAIAAANPDAELLDLGRQHAEADARYNALNDRSEAAHEAAIAAYPPAPQALYHRPGIDPIWFDIRPDFGAPADAWAVAQWRDCLSRDRWSGPLSKAEYVRVRAVEITAAWDGWMDAQEQVQAALGLPELERQLDAEGRALTEIEHRIFALRAKTPAGWQLKARLARRAVMDPYPQPDGTYEDLVVRSLLSDLTEERSLG